MLPSLNENKALGYLASIFIGTTILDLALGQHPGLKPLGHNSYIGTSFFNRVIPIVASIITIIGVLGASITFSKYSDLSWQAFVACAAVVGIINGAVTIVSAHELIHRSANTDQTIGAIAMSFCWYPCFYREHIHGHHNNVGTREDSATARMDENIYRFLIRAVRGNVKGSWRIERRLLLKRNRKTWSLYNSTLMLWLLSLVVLICLWTFHSTIAAAFFLVQGIIAIVVLETINYIQHYGLIRHKAADGKLEPIQPKHSFNATFWFSNVAFLNLLLHSDHHSYPMRPFSILRLNASAPVLPLPAFLMMVIAYLPPLWYLLMNRRATRANLT